ncbi:MAG: transglycosylase domain-containing protein, partial [Clostridia bacterium]|nr:transglycosylase domain-containing protein [Clostridia bacterium]
MKSKTQTQNSTKSTPKSKKRKKILIATLSCIVLIPLLSIAIAIATFAIWANSQHIDKSLLPTATALPVYYDISGNELPSEQSDFVEPNEINDNLKNAFVALEDKRFYKHNGYDVVRMAGAMVKNIKAGRIREGASTITQQLVKNTHLTQERTLSRKLKELAIAIQLEKEYSKDEILSMYLSVIYFGNGAYGVKQAASTYFDKTIDELDVSECAILAGIVRNPSKYSPISNPEECKGRRNVALSVMREQGYIDEDIYQNTVTLPVLTKKDRTNNSENLSARTCEFYLTQVQNEVCEKLNMTKYQLSNSGLKIYTNLDSSLQAELEKQRLDINNYESDSINSVSIILDNESGAVLAYSSSYPYNISRQAGSVLK